MDSSILHQVASKKSFTRAQGGKIEYKPKDLNITWGNDKRYWKIDDEAAELLQVSWLQVTGELAVEPKSKKNYKISFVVSLEPNAFGWEGIQIYVMAKFGKRGQYVREVFSVNSEAKFLTIDTSGFKSPRRDETDPTLYFGLYEVFSGVWKGGLKIHKATVEQV